jgi:hypothetical protein
MKRDPAARTADWRRMMGRELMWLLAAKFAALVCLWLLFFSPDHRQPADANATSRQLAITPVINADRTIRPGEKGHD